MIYSTHPDRRLARFALVAVVASTLALFATACDTRGTDAGNQTRVSAPGVSTDSSGDANPVYSYVVRPPDALQTSLAGDGSSGDGLAGALGAPVGPGGCNIIQFAIVPGVCIGIELYQNVQSLTQG